MPRRKKSWLHRRLKLSHHKHTGKHLHRAESSFGVLVIIVAICGGLLFFATKASAATSSSLNGSLLVSGVVEPTAENTHQGVAIPSSGSIDYGSWKDPTTMWSLFTISFGVVVTFWLGEHFAAAKNPRLWKTRKA
jgi:hypothetical protein